MKDWNWTPRARKIGRALELLAWTLMFATVYLVFIETLWLHGN